MEVRRYFGGKSAISADMKTNTIPSIPTVRRKRDAFTLTELIVTLAVLALLILIRVSAMASATNQTKRGQCAANLRQFTLAMHIYAGENGDRLPSASVTFWAFDAPVEAGTFVEATGSKWTVMYCPGTAPRFSETDNWNLYNFSASFRTLGYANTFPNNSGISSSNINATLTPARGPIGFGVATTPLASERVLLADATISLPGQNSPAQRYTYNYVSLQGGYAVPHVSAHLDGRFPAGGNLAMLDGHVEWRKFEDMTARTSSGSSPVFWW
jgi:prepilin-type N-terminal cleavage/methylation domain-containing protein/prepilin-type processing-associated H-X9-DG protein